MIYYNSNKKTIGTIMASISALTSPLLPVIGASESRPLSSIEVFRAAQATTRTRINRATERALAGAIFFISSGLALIGMIAYYVPGTDRQPAKTTVTVSAIVALCSAVIYFSTRPPPQQLNNQAIRVLIPPSAYS